MRPTLVVTNDFGPRAGGIESFVNALVERLPRGSVVVHTSDQEGAREYDEHLLREFDIEVVRDPMKMLVPTRNATKRVVATAKKYGCTQVWFGAAAPLGLMAPALKRAGIKRTLATTHGHELWWAKAPGSRQLLHRIGEQVDSVTYLGEYTRSRIAQALSDRAIASMRQLTPGVDEKHFHPGIDASGLKEKLGIGDRPVIVVVGRLVHRKGQDRLIDALPVIHQEVPRAALLICGEGPLRDDLKKQVAQLNLESDVFFAGRVSWEELPLYISAGDLFAMPSRNRLGGLEVEGLGIVYLEASACGLPVIAGDSGGAPDAVLEGESGFVVDGTSAVEISRRAIQLLQDPALRARMGARGRLWVEEKWRWDQVAARHQALLAGDL
ncbi:MAG: glycosyltransferase family 4 protein [Actinomycetes bacterium]